MENEQVERLQQETSTGWGLRTSDPKRELLSSIGLFTGMGLLGFWFGVGAALGSKMINSLEELISSSNVLHSRALLQKVPLDV